MGELILLYMERLSSYLCSFIFLLLQPKHCFVYIAVTRWDATTSLSRKAINNLITSDSRDLKHILTLQVTPASQVTPAIKPLVEKWLIYQDKWISSYNLISAELLSDFQEAVMSLLLQGDTNITLAASSFPWNMGMFSSSFWGRWKHQATILDMFLGGHLQL